jgi:hypothetical protein
VHGTELLRRSKPGLVLAATAVCSVWLRGHNPYQAGHYPTCPFLAVTGWYCPGCGSLRGLYSLLHGDPVQMVERNPALPLGLALLAAIWTTWCQRTLTGQPRRWAAPGWAIWLLFAATMVFWVARNLPAGAWLAP